jgi:predicted GIY-YIG superfamily endonuclease
VGQSELNFNQSASQTRLRMKQLLLLPDPRPLVERLGQGFFAEAPERPGVYLMRDASDTVLYVGKAKNLRKRLGSYRVANPDRMRRRHLRLLRAIERIELQECPDETTALNREAELLRNLRPRFNRAGTWTGPRRYLAWRLTDLGLELTVLAAAMPDWHYSESMGAGAFPLRVILARLLWSALWPGRGYTGMPEGWFAGRFGERILLGGTHPTVLETASCVLGQAVHGEPGGVAAWIRERTASQTHPFERAMLALDLEAIETLQKG